MTEKLLKPSISFRPAPEIADQLKARAAKDRRPLSHLVANLVTDALAAEAASRDHSEAA